MKHLTTIILLFITLISKGQDITIIEEVKSKDTIPTGQAIIYGNFIQRLGFSSGGFPQDIRLINLDTKEIYSFRVKPTYKSAKENTFIFTLKPGNYGILNYWWTQSKWYGGKTYTEPIFKGIDTTIDSDQKNISGKVREVEMQQFTFSLMANSLNYLGTWHFDKGLVFFTDDKKQFDESIKSKYQKLDFQKAKIVLPN